MRKERLGFAVCGSFCNHEKALELLRALREEYETVIPILSENSAVTDTRFGTAREFRRTVEKLTGRECITDIVSAEPIGSGGLLDVLLIAPCTGNTLAKLAAGITDTSVTMATKAHLRNGKPVVLAIATNDALGASAANIGTLLNRKNYFFVPFSQDDAAGKPNSMIADFSLAGAAVDAALQNRQLQPILL